uniref:Uncharacterized protein n=1 Tax=Tanacetum cinerariifolium TaxID=118510 RepID=A0A6L2L5Z2_TANCI|nr:hypothetical protein [Tanacetum cinerariifolium]
MKKSFPDMLHGLREVNPTHAYFNGSRTSKDNEDPSRKDELRTKKVITFRLRDYWLSISSEEELHLSRSLDSTIRRPILRVLQKMITYGVCQRTNGLVDGEMAKEEGSRKPKGYLSALIYCITLDAITLRELIGPDGRLIAEDPTPGGVLERMARRQSYQCDRYARVFEYMARQYNILVHGVYAPPSIMGKPLSPDRVFDFPMDEPEPQYAYDFFAPRPLTGYVSNLNNTNGWIKAYVPLLGELGEPLGAEVDKPLVDPVIDELAEPIVKVKEQMVAPMMDMEEDLAMLFGDDDFRYDGLDDEEDDKEVWDMDEDWLMAPVTPPLMPVMPPPKPGVPVPPSVIEELCTRMGNLEYGRGQLVKKVITMSDTEVADSIAIGELGPRFSTVKGQMQVMESQMVRVMSKLEQVGAHVEQGASLMWRGDLQDLSSPIGSDSRHLEIITIGCTGLGTKDCNSWGNFGFGESFARTYSKVVGRMVRWLDDEIPRNWIPTLRRDLLGVARSPRWVEAKVDRVDYASRGAETLELELRSSSNEQRAHDAQLFS